MQWLNGDHSQVFSTHSSRGYGTPDTKVTNFHVAHSVWGYVHRVHRYVWNEFECKL